MNQRMLLRRLAAAVIFVTAVRILSVPFSQFAGSGRLLSLLLYTNTGRTVNIPETEPTLPAATEPTENSIPPTQTTQPTVPTGPEAVLSFSYGDLELVSVRYHCDYRPDLQALLASGLALDLTGDAPTVLIVHTHTTECYTGASDTVESYRSLNQEENMLAIGDEVARVLELGGITVIHDRTVHDYPDYNSSYTAARATIRDYLERYPTIELVLDLHRDAVSTTSGQYATAATVGGQPSAQLMMVVGTDAGGLNHPGWQDNLALALKLCVLLEQENPGICRPVSLRSQRFNMDLSAGSLLVEVGAAGNTQEEALIAANALARAILALRNGCEEGGA